MAKRGIYFDTETTGVNIKGDRIIELAAFDPHFNRTFARLINPGIPIPPDATAIHGITDAMVQDAPPFSEVMREFLTFCEGDIALIAHNGEAFDLPFLEEEARRHGLTLPSWPIIDSLKWARKYRSDLPRHSLQFLRQIYGVAENQVHRALDDVVVLYEVFRAMIDDLTIDTVFELMKEKSSLPSNVMPFGKHKGKPLPELPKDYVEWLKKQDILQKKENQDLKVALEKYFA